MSANVEKGLSIAKSCQSWNFIRSNEIKMMDRRRKETEVKGAEASEEHDEGRGVEEKDRKADGWTDEYEEGGRDQWRHGWMG